MEPDFGTRPPHQPDRPLPADPRPQRRRSPLLAIAGVVLLALLGAGAYLALRSLGSDSDEFAVSSCVKESGRRTGVPARCTDAGAFVIVAKVDRVKDCPDANQPYLELAEDGRTQVLCLAPAGAGDGAPTAVPSVVPS
ncbi:MAG TPA: hypothetical protein VFB84_21085 [Micromonosporaceae bacterium]|nr:hypothetical protein [Micromonosporaceae bacterium]